MRDAGIDGGEVELLAERLAAARAHARTRSSPAGSFRTAATEVMSVGVKPFCEVSA